VGTVGGLSEDPYENGLWPLLMSGTCKKETGPEHARVINTVLKAFEAMKHHENTTYWTVSIASDGESKCGDALVLLMMHSSLHPYSPIFSQLHNLELMNFLVGHDDITADKDFKHVFKWQRNLLMRNKGIEIQGFCVTPPMLRAQLQSNGVPSPRLNSLLNPNDKQDVVLGYSSLKEIWSLPLLSPQASSQRPAFSQAREVLQIYGKFAYHLIMPYICIDLNLDKRLIHLSTAAHMAMYLYTDNSACTKFMPN
jgi:hypothetical protein